MANHYQNSKELPNTVGGGKTITSSAGRAINISGADGVTIRDLTVECSGERAINVIQNANNVVIEDCVLTAANYTINVALSAPEAKMDITGCTITGLNAVNIASPGAEITIDNSTVNCYDNDTTEGESFAALCLNKDATGGSIIATNTTVNVTEGSDSKKGRNGASDGTVTINGSTEDVVVMVAAITYPNSNYYHSFSTLAEAIKFAKDGDTISLIRDIVVKEKVTVDKELNLNLNGHKISGAFDNNGGSALIENKGNLSIIGEGKIVSLAQYPDVDWGTEGFPTYATNTISNRGTLYINGDVTIENQTNVGGASYAIDNYGGSNLTIDNGKIVAKDVAIRLFCGSPIDVTINGGEITGKRAIWIQLAGSSSNVAPNVNLSITGGTFDSTSDLTIYSYSYGNSFANTNVSISGGEFSKYVAFGGGYKGDKEKVTVTGGKFYSGIGRYLANDGWEDISKPTGTA